MRLSQYLVDRGQVGMGRVGMVLDLVTEFVMGRVYQGPSLSWAEFVMGRDVPESTVDEHTQLMCTISMEGNVSSPFRMYFQIWNICVIFGTNWYPVIPYTCTCMLVIAGSCQIYVIQSSHHSCVQATNFSPIRTPW